MSSSSPQVGSTSAPLRPGLIAVLVGIGVGWSHTPTTLLITGLCVLIALTTQAPRRQLICAAIVPSLTWLELRWPASALLAIAAAVTLGWRPALVVVRPSGRWLMASAGVLIIGVAAAAPLANSRTAATPLLINAHRPSVAVVTILIVAAALLNATGEELLWRGLIYDTCADLHAGLLVASQACSFGLAHAHGVPAGVEGVLAAGLFGAALAVLRPRIGLPAVIALHACVDAVIFAVTVHNAIFTNR